MSVAPRLPLLAHADDLLAGRIDNGSSGLLDRSNRGGFAARFVMAASMELPNIGERERVTRQSRNNRSPRVPEHYSSDSGEVRSCRTFCEKMRREPSFSPDSIKLTGAGQFWSLLAKVGRCVAIFDQNWPTLPEVRPTAKICQCGQELVRIDQTWTILASDGQTSTTNVRKLAAIDGAECAANTPALHDEPDPLALATRGGDLQVAFFPRPSGGRTLRLVARQGSIGLRVFRR